MLMKTKPNLLRMRDSVRGEQCGTNNMEEPPCTHNEHSSTEKVKIDSDPTIFQRERKHKTMLDTMCLKHYLISGILKQLMNTVMELQTTAVRKPEKQRKSLLVAEAGHHIA
ncbi:hypothetical protein S245_027023, partial [Arachis hypogaea]